MSYMLLIIEPTGQRASRTEAEGRAAYAAMQRFGQAIAWAHACPAAPWCTVEVRPLAPCYDESAAT